MKILRKNIWSRAINRIHTTIATKFHEKKWGNDENRVKYMFFPSIQNKLEKNVLAVCFPAFAGKGAKYNYVRTLHDFNIHKLFLLDDIGGSDNGNYLIKEGVEQNVITLIQEIIDKYQPKKLIFFGSSKGGYSALNFSLHFKNVNVCIAAPQYFLADYLIREKKNDNLEVILDKKEYTEEDLSKLNYRLKNSIANSINLPEIVSIHYSTNEHTYKEHIVDLIKDLEDKDVRIIKDIESYSNHMDLVYYFPYFLKKTINNYINE